MRQMSFESVGTIRPGCPARPAAARFRRAFEWPILTRPPIRATQPSILLQISVKSFSYGMNIGLPIGKESLTKQKKIFPLELRAKTFFCPVFCNTIIRTGHCRNVLLYNKIRQAFYSISLSSSVKVGIS